MVSRPAQAATGTLTLSGAAPSTPNGGAVVFLSSNLRRVASVAQSVTVPAGKTTVDFPVTVYHVHREPEEVTIRATYGKDSREGKLKVAPADYNPSGRRTAQDNGHAEDE